MTPPPPAARRPAPADPVAAMPPIPCQRALFAIPREVCYLNTAANAPMTREAALRLEAGARAKLRPWERTGADFFRDAEAIRRLAGAALGGGAENWAVVPSASYATGTAARALERHVAPGAGIVVLENAFPSNFLPWARLAAETGARLVTAPAPADHDWTAAVTGCIDARTALVAVDMGHWTNAARLDLAAIGAAARAVGARLVLDLTQSLGAVPLDWEAVRPDFVAASGYKWLLFPYGTSLLWVAPEWQDARPLEESWLAREGADDFSRMLDLGAPYMPGARRFDMGEKGAPATLPAAVAALERIAGWGVPAIGATLAHWCRRIEAALEGLPLEPVPEAHRLPNIVAFRLLREPPAGFHERFAEAGVHFSLRGEWLRFAPYLHVDEDDIARLREVARAILG